MNPVLFKAMVKFCTANQLFTVYCFRKFVFCLASEGIMHLTVDDAMMTYEIACQKCIGQGLDLCSNSEICPHGSDGIPSITGTLLGDKWAPIRWVVKMLNGLILRSCYIWNIKSLICSTIYEVQCIGNHDEKRFETGNCGTSVLKIIKAST